MRSTSTTSPKPQPRTLSSLRLRRLALGLPLWQIARGIGIDTPTLNRLERGERQDPGREEKVGAFLAGLERTLKKHPRA